MMLSHGCVPIAMHRSIIIPIAKNTRKPLNDGNNYRGIALSSILGKALDCVIINTINGGFDTSDYQLGFKPEHSTSHCTFVVK